MTVTPTNLQWDQAEDLVIRVTYSVNGSVPSDFTQYSARMDIARPARAGAIVSLHTFNTDDGVESTEDEITINPEGTIDIVVPRSLTIMEDEPGADPELHPIGNDLKRSATAKYVYDLFLRDAGGYQKKIMEGEITVKRSVTKWL